MLKTNAGPWNWELWVQQLKEECQSLIQYVENNKNIDINCFWLESNKEETRWFGKCWYHLFKYKFDIEFDITITYPTTAPEIAVPEVDGKTTKMYRSGKICLTDHFKSLWARSMPEFGLAHLMALGLGSWLAVEIPNLIQKGMIQHKEKCSHWRIKPLRLGRGTLDRLYSCFSVHISSCSFDCFTYTLSPTTVTK